MITAELICDSITPAGNRLSTFVLTYPRFIHSEFMTHRCFSRNAASSRAIPLHKMMDAVEAQVATPEYWGANQKGMQAAAELEEPQQSVVRSTWFDAARDALRHCRILGEHNAHKQIANRVLEPFSHITVIATSGEMGLRNFFSLRAHKDAQPEFQVLAYRMLHLWLRSKPEDLAWGEWHIPFDNSKENEIDLRLKVATGCIARVSYLTHDGKRDAQADVDLHDRLKESCHWSPFEHCARAVQYIAGNSNFGPNWRQYRKKFDEECAAPSNSILQERLNNRPAWFSL